MNSMFSLKEKAIVVTGGTGILGNAFINGIVEAGGSVGILGRNEKLANERAASINTNGGMKKVMDINLWGTVIPTQIFGEAIADTGKGSIVNISSMNSKRAITKVLGYNM